MRSPEIEIAVKVWIENDTDTTLTSIHNALCHCDYIEEGALGRLLTALQEARS